MVPEPDFARFGVRLESLTYTMTAMVFKHVISRRRLIATRARLVLPGPTPSRPSLHC
jgi:hypothetical protein